MSNFDDLIYILRYEAESIIENLNDLDDCDGDEAKVQTVLKWIKMSASDIENRIDEYRPEQGITTADLRNEKILDYPRRAI